MSMFKYLVVATVLAVSPACSKKPAEGKAPAEGSGSAVAAAGSGSGSAAPAAPAEPPMPAALPPLDPAADFVSVFATHKEPKPIDPVEVRFDKFTVTKAKFDPKNLEGGTATLEIDLASLHTTSVKRDGHLKSPAYIDVAKFATITVDVDNVKKKDGATYTADANVKFHGVEKKLPVTFDVIETKDDSVRIKGEAKYSRVDFGVGKDPSDKEETTNAEQTIKLQLTLKNT